MLRNVAAGILGVVLAVSLVMVVQTIGHTVYPPPPDLDLSDADAMRAVVAAMPAGAMLFVVFSWSLGAFGGTLLACKIATAQAHVFAAIVGGLILAGTIYTLVTISHPLWMAALGIVGIALGTWAGMLIGGARQGAGE